MGGNNFLLKMKKIIIFAKKIIMKNLLNKTQQKIYAIYQTLKTYASKLRISLFVGGQFKKQQASNNPKLTELMNEKMTFKQLKDREFELKEEKSMLNAKIGNINNYHPQDRWKDNYNQLVNRLEIVIDLLKGVDTKLSEIGHTYIVTYKKTVKKQFPIEQEETYTNEIKLLVENRFNNPLTSNDCEEILRLTYLEVPYEILNIRYINKK